MLQNNIKKRLLDKKMSANELERICGLKQSAIQNILYGRSKNPTIEIVKSIAQGLGCSIEQLIGNENTINFPINKSDTMLPWEPALFIKCIETIQILFDKKESKLSFEQAITCATEVYKYSIKSSTMVVDKRFAEWLVERFYQ